MMPNNSDFISPVIKHWMKKISMDRGELQGNPQFYEGREELRTLLQEILEKRLTTFE